MINKKLPKFIVFDTRSGIGDSIEYIPAIYMLSLMYPNAYLLVTTNKLGANLYSNFNFISKVVNIHLEHENPDLLFQNIINGKADPSYPQQVADLVFLAERSSHKIKIALKTKCPRIITFSYLKALFLPRLHFTPHFHRKNIHEVFHYQHIVREADRKLYDQCFAQADFSKVRLEPTLTQENYVNDFLKSIKVQNFKYIITINPHSYTSEKRGYNLKLEDFLNLAKSLASHFPHILFIITSYGTHAFHEQDLALENLKLFVNDDNLMHLVALIKQSSLTITPSTGNAHISDNLGVDVIGPWPFYDEIRWAANGLEQLTQKQGKSYNKVAKFKCVRLEEGWQAHVQERYQHLEQLCIDYIRANLYN